MPSKDGKMKNIILFLYGLLLFILPIPHIIGIRNITFVLLSILLIYELIKTNKTKEFLKNMNKKIFVILLILTLWIFTNAFFISKYTLLVIPEIWGQWIIPVFYLLIGLLLGYLYSYKTILQITILILFIHILYLDLNELDFYLKTHHIITRLPGLTDGPDKSNYLTNILLIFLITEFILRIRNKINYLNINNFILILMLLLTILSSVFEGMRNGVVAILFIFLSAIIFTFYKNNNLSRKFKIIISLSLLIILSIPAIYNFTHDKRWNTLFQTIPIALNTDKYKFWFNKNKYPTPKLKNGKTVSLSNYERIAWAKIGLEEILRNPLGYGYKRNIFKYAINSDKKFKWGKTTAGHSHSGLIDLTLGIGIPGLILWLSFIIYLIYLSLKNFKNYFSYFSVLLFFNTAGFFTRSIVDSNIRDHMFLMFMLIIGFVFFAMQKELNEKNNLSSP